MIPEGGAITETPAETEQMPSRTWRIDFAKGRIAGMVDGLEAVKQAVYKILQTLRYEHEIYSFDYGHELQSQVGGNPLYVQSEATRKIHEALKQDDRIESITILSALADGDTLNLNVKVDSVFGAFSIAQGVGSGV